MKQQIVAEHSRFIRTIQNIVTPSRKTSTYSITAKTNGYFKPLHNVERLFCALLKKQECAFCCVECAAG